MFLLECQGIGIKLSIKSCNVKEIMSLLDDFSNPFFREFSGACQHQFNQCCFFDPESKLLQAMYTLVYFTVYGINSNVFLREFLYCESSYSPFLDMPDTMKRVENCTEPYSKLMESAMLLWFMAR